MMPGDYRDGDGQSTITELHRQVSSTLQCEAPARNLRQSEVHSILYSLLNLSTIFIIINHDDEFIYLDIVQYKYFQ